VAKLSVDISVVVPTFHRPRQLAEALESVLSQQGPSLEVLVIDDGPQREGEEVVKTLGDARVRYIAMGAPTGGNPSRVRNAGWPHAEGRLLHFLDDDDRVESGAYRDMAAAFEAAPDSGVVIGRVTPFGDDLQVLERERKVFTTAARRARRLGRVGSRFLCAAHQLFGNPTLLVNSGCMVRREVVARINGYDEEIRIMEDIDFYARAIRDAGFVFRDRPFVGYRTGAPSIMNRNQGKSVAPSFDRMYAKYAEAHGHIELRVAQIVARAVLTHL
jgi:glycosyltransferase involved in cell wall biosynthesis